MKVENLPVTRERVSVDNANIKPHPKNPRKGKTSLIKDSIKVNGYYPTIFVQRSTGHILKGSHTWKAVKELVASGFEQYREIEVNFLDVNDDEALRIVLADNAASDFSSYSNDSVFDILNELSKTDAGLIGTGWTTEDFDNLKFTLGKAEIYDEQADKREERAKPDEDVESNSDDESTIIASDGSKRNKVYGVPDIIFPSQNDFGIPQLDITKQATEVSLPAACWGSQRGRKLASQVGTYFFYTTDDILEVVWNKPEKVVNTAVSSCVEPNFSVYPQSPHALNVWNTYRKRWCGRYLQSKGIKLFVDMFIPRDFWEVGFIGVPDGWRAWATRGDGSELADDMLEDYFQFACERANTDDILFVVYGGASSVRNRCAERGWFWQPEEMALVQGQHKDAIENPKGKRVLDEKEPLEDIKESNSDATE